jgi:hypothetical protein
MLPTLVKNPITPDIPVDMKKEKLRASVAKYRARQAMERAQHPAPEPVVEAPAPAPAPAPALEAPEPEAKSERKVSNATLINRKKKQDVKQAVIDAIKEYNELVIKFKDDKNPIHGQLSINARTELGKANEKIRGAKISQGGGTLVSLTDKEFETLLKKKMNI